ncbi:DUF6941 family protein [Gracilibacillus salinarum]|uniref:Uncharacterized protein n=1 Tax=Gracilibacillus salinarum TaxID=2932255 RepID=A0ABY4GN82_9BACI|nr:hypothetical protein [Gracilibacillus salinarum]UOQ85704.1 hypothetical protein MUN87_02010 [Gracilibacillus salinarum]
MGYAKVNNITFCKDITMHDDGTNTYHNVFDVLTFDSFPKKLEFLVIVGLEYNLQERDNRHFYFHFKSPKGKKIGDKIKQQFAPSEKKKTFIEGQFKFKNFPVETEGFYEFYIEYNDEVIGSNLIYIQDMEEGD